MRHWIVGGVVAMAACAAALVVAAGQSASAASTCSIYWTGSASANWNATANWSSSDGGPSAGRLPARSDYVCMSTAPTRATVSLSTSASIDGISWAKTATVTPVLQVSGSLTVGNTEGAFPSTIANLQANGTITTITSISVSTLSLQSNGTLGGAGSFTVAAGGSLSIAGGELASGAHLVNQGTATVAQGARLNFTQAAVFENAASLSLGDGSVMNLEYQGRVVNDASATLKYAGSAASSTASINVPFDNYGAVSVTQGTLDLSGGSSSFGADTGSYSAAAAGVVLFGGGIRQLTGQVTFPGPGQVSVSGQLDIASGVALTMTNLLLSNGTMSGRGSLTVPAGGNADLASGTIEGGFHLLNQGTVAIAAIATLTFMDASELQNAGTLKLADDAQIGYPCCNSGANGFFVNKAGATVSYTGSATSSTSTVYVPFDNYGAVNVLRGTLIVDAPSSSESSGDTGSYTVAPAGALTFENGPRTLAASATFPGSGQVTISGQVNVDAGIALNMTDLLLSSGTLGGGGSIVIPSGGNATLATSTLSDGFHLVNRGATTVSTNSTVAFTDQSTLENLGSLMLSDGDQVGYPTCCQYQADGTLSNEPGATMSYTGSASNSASTVGVAFDNFATVTVGRGTLDLNGGSSGSSAGDTGAYNISGAAFLQLGGSRLFKAAVSFPGAGQVDVGGTLDFLGSTTLPSLGWTGGTVEIGAGSVVKAAVNGTPSGILKLDGDRPAHFGSFVATGALNVGSLYLQLSNETFAPPCGQSIVAAQGTSLAGQFAGYEDNLLPEGGSLQTSYTATAGRALVYCPPPPAQAVQTYGTGRTFDMRNPSGYYAEPVNTATGAYSTEQTDAELHSLGVPFAFTRYYTSSNTSSGWLGPGWTDSLSASLEPQGSTVYLTSENGQQASFTQQSDGSYAASPGVYSRLTQTGGGWTLRRRDRSQLSFDTTGRLLSIKDGNGVGLTLSYGSGGELASVKDAAGRTVTFSYSQGLLTSIALPLSRTVSYTYNSSGQLSSVTDPAGDVTSYAYNSAGELATITDANGHVVVQNVYDGEGHVVGQTNAVGQKSTFAYEPGTGTTTYTDARGHKWIDQYNGDVLVKRTDPLGDATSYSYDANLDVSAVTTPNGNTTLMDYDGSGNMLDRTSPSPYDYEETWTYNTQDEPLTYKDRRGLTTKYAYDSRGNLLKVTAPDGTSVSSTYDPATGALLSSTTASGKTTAYGYDSAGDLIKQTSPLGEITTYGYDGAGRRTSKVSPRGNVSGATPSQYTTKYGYDADDRQVSITNPLGAVTATTYDKVGNRLSVKDPNGHATTYAYNAANHLTSVTAADGTKTASTYDAVGNLATRVDADGHTTTYGYDAANRLTSRKTPLGHTTTYAYDRDGNLTKTVDAIGVAAGTGGTTTYANDALDRRTSVTYSDGTPSVKYTYDADSNRTAMTDGNGTKTYAYNNRNLLTKVTQGSTSFSYAYTQDGLVSSRTYPDGLLVSYAYDGDGRLASAANGGQTTAYAYDADGNLISTTLPSATGVVETRSYDKADRLIGIGAVHGATMLDSFAITRDAAGNPTALTTPGGPVTYSYDNRERLTRACYGASCATNTQTWTYDGVGNRLSSTSAGVTTTNTYDADNELTKSVTGATTVLSTYDADGRLTAAGANTYSWNLANELTVVGGANPATYSYDGDGNRVGVKIGANTTTQTWDVNNPLSQLATTQGPTGTQNYLWGIGSLGFTTSAGSFYQLHDEQESTIGIVSANGTLQSTATYDPFGVTIGSTKPVSTAPASQIGWQAQMLDANGQYDMRAREYDPSTGRFLSRDPVEPDPYTPATSSYLYANDMPTVGSDPSGLCALGIFGHGCSQTGKYVLAGLDVVAAVAGGVCAVLSDGTAVPCDAVAAWGLVSAANEVYNVSSDGSEGGGGSYVSTTYNYNSSYNSSSSYYYGGYGGRRPNK